MSENRRIEYRPSDTIRKHSEIIDNELFIETLRIIPEPQRPVSTYIPANEGPDYLKLILNARVYDVASETPLTLANKLSARMENTIYLKREDLQPIFSFKCRGAYNRMCQLTPEERERGVIAVSAGNVEFTIKSLGNHAQGVALAAKKLGIKATIVMPTFAPAIKVDSVRRLQANVVLKGDDFDDAKKECARLAQEHHYTFIHPFDDPHVIAGQGTVGVEILRQIRQDKLDAIFVCCGGGGLLAGIATYVKRIRPEVKVIGVNTVDSDSMYQSLNKGERVEIKEAGLFADGTAVRLIGSEPFRLCQQYVDDFVLVNNDEICAAIKDTFEDTRSVLEPAGALALAGLKKYIGSNPKMKNGVFVAVLSGANMNFDRLQFVAERAKLGDGNEVLLSAKVPETPGTLLKLYSVISPRHVTELSYRYHNADSAHIYIAFEVTNGATEAEEVVSALNAIPGFEVLDVSNNELAKSHAKYLAGGRATAVPDEVMYRLRFAERPGAFQRFITFLGKDSGLNITLLHYRNHGADIARILAGVQLPADKKQIFESKLQKLGYPFVDETENPVYKHFLV